MWAKGYGLEKSYLTFFFNVTSFFFIKDPTAFITAVAIMKEIKSSYQY